MISNVAKIFAWGAFIGMTLNTLLAPGVHNLHQLGSVAVALGTAIAVHAASSTGGNQPKPGNTGAGRIGP